MAPKHHGSLTVAVPLWTKCLAVLFTVAMLAPTQVKANKGTTKPFSCSDYPRARICLGAGAFKRLSPPAPRSHRFEADNADLKTLMQFNGPPEYGEYGPNDVKLPEQLLQDILRKYWNHETWSED